MGDLLPRARDLNPSSTAGETVRSLINKMSAKALNNRGYFSTSISGARVFHADVSDRRLALIMRSTNDISLRADSWGVRLRNVDGFDTMRLVGDDDAFAKDIMMIMLEGEPYGFA